jgi:uncharacterized RDD family membrane protein YckC
MESIFPEKKEPVYAGFWIRAAASFIDFFILMVPAILIRFLMPSDEAPLYWFLTQSNAFGESLLLVINITYYCYLEQSSLQATLGKRALGLKVTDAYGDRITFGKAVARYFAKFLSAAILGIGFLLRGRTKSAERLVFSESHCCSRIQPKFARFCRSWNTTIYYHSSTITRAETGCGG